MMSEFGQTDKKDTNLSIFDIFHLFPFSTKSTKDSTLATLNSQSNTIGFLLKPAKTFSIVYVQFF